MGGCSSRYRYSYVDHAFLRPLKPQFDALMLSPFDIGKLLEVFNSIDEDKSGMVSVKELFARLALDRTTFTDRVFALFDEDGSGQIDFREFVLTLWNYCTLSKAALVIFAFDLYDLDATGSLSPSEVEKMLHDIYGSHAQTNAQARQIVKELSSLNSASDVSVEKFKLFTANHPALLFPAFQMQHGLRTQILGSRFWDNCAAKRMQLSDGKRISMGDFANVRVSGGISHPTDELAMLLENTGTHHDRKLAAQKRRQDERERFARKLAAERLDGGAGLNELDATDTGMQYLMEIDHHKKAINAKKVRPEPESKDRDNHNSSADNHAFERQPPAAEEQHRPITKLNNVQQVLQIVEQHNQNSSSTGGVRLLGDIVGNHVVTPREKLLHQLHHTEAGHAEHHGHGHGHRSGHRHHADLQPAVEMNHSRHHHGHNSDHDPHKHHHGTASHQPSRTSSPVVSPREHGKHRR